MNLVRSALALDSEGSNRRGWAWRKKPTNQLHRAPPFVEGTGRRLFSLFACNR
jgi:hypothetical protein